MTAPSICAAPGCPNVRPCPVHPVAPRLMGRRRKEARERVIQRDGRYCADCGRGPLADRDIHIDHRLPLIQGGTNGDGNLQVTCRECNLGKGANS